jgi:hypothetical protein
MSSYRTIPPGERVPSGAAFPVAGDLALTCGNLIALIDPSGDRVTRDPNQTQYDLKISTIPSGMSVLVVDAPTKDRITRVIYEGRAYYVDSNRLEPVEA